MKQETIEEAAWELAKQKFEEKCNYKPNLSNSQHLLAVSSIQEGILIGAKWQQERMYSEAIEFAEWIRIKDFQTTEKDNWIGLELRYYTTEELFEQFKKK